MVDLHEKKRFQSKNDPLRAKVLVRRLRDMYKRCIKQ